MDKPTTCKCQYFEWGSGCDKDAIPCPLGQKYTRGKTKGEICQDYCGIHEPYGHAGTEDEDKVVEILKRQGYTV